MLLFGGEGAVLGGSKFVRSKLAAWFNRLF